MVGFANAFACLAPWASLTSLCNGQVVNLVDVEWRVWLVHTVLCELLYLEAVDPILVD